MKREHGYCRSNVLRGAKILFSRMEMIKSIGSNGQKCLFLGEGDQVLIRIIAPISEPQFLIHLRAEVIKFDTFQHLFH